MSVIIGRCQHGKIVSAAVEDMSSEESLTDMAASYTLERVPSASLGGQCDPCRERYLANMQLLGLKP